MEPPHAAAVKRAIAGTFSRTSATHDTVGTPLFADVGSALVASMELGPGDRVLDVAAGTGATMLPSARRVGSNGRVVGVDLAPGMVERLRARVSAEGLPNAAVGVADAERLPFASGSFDALVCGFALFFFPDPDGALKEFRRVLRAGATLGLSTFAPKGRASLDRIRHRIVAHREGPPAPPDTAAFDQPPALRQALETAGFVEVTVEAYPIDLVLPGVDGLWDWLWTMEFGDDLEMMDAQAREAVRRSLAADLAPTGAEAPEIRLPMDALLTRASTPPAGPTGG